MLYSLLLIIRFGSTYICVDESIKNVHFGKISQYLNSLLVKQYSTYCKNGYNLIPKLKLTKNFLLKNVMIVEDLWHFPAITQCLE